MFFTRPVLDEDSHIDFYAGSEQAATLLRPVWNALPQNRRGTFYPKDFGNYLPGHNPLVITSPEDLQYVFYAGEEERPFILIEFEHHNATQGLMGTVSLFLCREEKTLKLRKAYLERGQVAMRYDSAANVSNTLVAFIIGSEPKRKDKCGEASIGLLYMAFGKKAATAVQRSVATLKRIGYSYPVCVVGDEPVLNFKFVHWAGESPFDPTMKKNFQFRAGRIKPKLYELSPFDYTLYIDADTEFIQDIYPGFELLKKYDVAVTQEYLTVGQLYNEALVGWEINLKEREQTVKEGVPDADQFLNSGVIFFKKSPATKKLFAEWHKQWLRFQQWDEQLALMRAIQHTEGLKTKYLLPMWNEPHPNDATIIFHNYGRATIREST